MDRILASETVAKVGERVLIKGWVHNKRKMGKLIFLDIRDCSGIVQAIVVTAELDEATVTAAKNLHHEDVVAIEGEVQRRERANADLATGTVELLVKTISVLNESKVPPFEINKDTGAINEELRLQYRYLDLRTERMAANLRRRARMVSFMRQYLDERGFLEVETPMLTKGTPEGAREFIVPSRLYPGHFYVLPQSPQQFKQLLQVAGTERYYQIARCFRDEDQRGDRQPEFTQLDLEMSFIEQEDIIQLTEGLMIAMVAAVTPEKRIQEVPFPRLTYAHAMKQYGTDKPDLRSNPQDKNTLAFCWVVDFPLFEKNADGELQSTHHPFTSPHPADIGFLDADPLRARANAYDIVLNGYEVGGGSIRIHDRALQNRIFHLLGISDEDIALRFGHMLEAFEYGAPPHGGIAPGVDRLAMILAGEPNIREVIPFPKTGDARDVMMGAPSPLPPRALHDVHIDLKKG